MPWADTVSCHTRTLAFNGHTISRPEIRSLLDADFRQVVVPHQKFEHDDLSAIRARGTKSPLPLSSRNRSIRRPYYEGSTLGWTSRKKKTGLRGR